MPSAGSYFRNRGRSNTRGTAYAPTRTCPASGAGVSQRVRPAPLAARAAGPNAPPRAICWTGWSRIGTRLPKAWRREAGMISACRRRGNNQAERDLRTAPPSQSEARSLVAFVAQKAPTTLRVPHSRLATRFDVASARLVGPGWPAQRFCRPADHAPARGLSSYFFCQNGSRSGSSSAAHLLVDWQRRRHNVVD
jgi:hypothetical protein